MIDPQWPEVVNNVHYVWIPVTRQLQSHSYFVYVPITKCASTYLSNAMPADEFDSQQWRYLRDSNGPIPKPEHTQWFVVLRDPWSRWISGITHWLTHCRNNWQYHIDLVIDQIEMDVHTCPQHQFLTMIDRARTTFMRYQPDICQHPWFQQQGWQLIDVAVPRRNITVRADIQRALEDRITTADKYRIKDYYHQDYELIRTVRFI